MHFSIKQLLELICFHLHNTIIIFSCSVLTVANIVVIILVLQQLFCVFIKSRILSSFSFEILAILLVAFFRHRMKCCIFGMTPKFILSQGGNNARLVVVVETVYALIYFVIGREVHFVFSMSQQSLTALSRHRVILAVLDIIMFLY